MILKIKLTKANSFDQKGRQRNTQCEQECPTDSELIACLLQRAKNCPPAHPHMTRDPKSRAVICKQHQILSTTNFAVERDTMNPTLTYTASVILVMFWWTKD